MNLDLHLVPYDSGRRGWRMGAGPEYFIHNGLVERLEAGGCAVQTKTIELDRPDAGEVSASFELYGKLSTAVNDSIQTGRFPVVLSGNCGAAVGGVMGIAEWPMGILWLDAHGDFNTPDTTHSGFLDGMGLAIAAGLCWKNLSGKVPHFYPVDGSHILHIGGSDIEPEEQQLMLDNGVQILSLEAIRSGKLSTLLLPALNRLRGSVQDVYVHLDLDVLDPARTPANHFLSTGGLAVAEVKGILQMVLERLNVRGVGVASYDPTFDPKGSTVLAGIELIELLCGK